LSELPVSSVASVVSTETVTITVSTTSLPTGTDATRPLSELARIPAPAVLDVDLVDCVRLEIPISREIDLNAPFFMDPTTVHALKMFVEEAPSSQPQFLLISGPFKSGKLTLLNQVLPQFVAADYHERARHSRVNFPIIVQHELTNESPTNAALKLLSVIHLHAKKLQLDFPFASPTLETAMLTLKEELSQFAQAIFYRGGRLWLLLDEFQV
jgi:hypothetical protein